MHFACVVKTCLLTLLVALSSAVVVLLLVPDSLAQEILLTSFRWISTQNKLAGSLLLTFSYAVSVVLLIPGTPFNLAAGYLFGISLGAPVALFGALFGGVFSFLFGRTLAREWAEKMARQHPKFRAIDTAIQRNGVNFVFLMRLSPLLPYPLVSYIFGISQVNFIDYVIGTAAGLIPVAIMESMIGAEMKNLTAAVSGSSHSRGSSFVWMTFVICSTAVMLIFITYFTQDAIHTAMQEVDATGTRFRSNSSQKKTLPP